jgi:hypothetical protein
MMGCLGHQSHPKILVKLYHGSYGDETYMNLRMSVKQLCSWIFVLSFTFVSPGFNASLAYQAKNEIQVQLDQFDIMTESSGWVLFDQQLFWTSDAGKPGLRSAHPFQEMHQWRMFNSLIPIWVGYW